MGASFAHFSSVSQRVKTHGQWALLSSLSITCIELRFRSRQTVERGQCGLVIWWRLPKIKLKLSKYFSK